MATMPGSLMRPMMPGMPPMGLPMPPHMAMTLGPRGPMPGFGTDHN